MVRRIVFLFVCMVLITGSLQAESMAEVDPQNIGRELVVGVTEIQPLVIKKGLDAYTGFDIELWAKIADINDWTYRFVEITIDQRINEVANGSVDLALSGISIMAEREKIVDFSTPYLSAGLATMVKVNDEADMIGTVKDLLNGRILRIFAIFCAIVVLFGHVAWIAERGEGSAIDDRYFPGILEGVYFIVVTISTVGYGDIAPKKWPGRMAVVFLILFGLAFFGWFIAEFSSSLTVKRMGTGIESHHDLQRKTVATIEGTTSVGALKEIGAIPVLVQTIDQAYEYLNDDIVKAVVFDAPVIRNFVLERNDKDLIVLDEVFNPEYYGIPLHEDSELKEKIDQAIMTLMENGTHAELVRRWFGN